MAEPFDLEAALDALFAGPLAEFVAARKAVVLEVKKDDRVLAKTLAKLSKPSVSAWAVNAARARAPELFDALMAVGDALRAAQSGDGDLRAATVQRRAAVRAAHEVALAALTDGGHAAAPATVRRIGQCLEAFVGYGRAQPSPTIGRLSEDLEPPGFEVLADLASVLAPAKVTTRAAPVLRMVPRPASTDAAVQADGPVSELPDAADDAPAARADAIEIEAHGATGARTEPRAADGPHPASAADDESAVAARAGSGAGQPHDGGTDIGEIADEAEGRAGEIDREIADEAGAGEADREIADEAGGSAGEIDGGRADSHGDIADEVDGATKGAGRDGADEPSDSVPSPAPAAPKLEAAARETAALKAARRARARARLQTQIAAADATRVRARARLADATGDASSAGDKLTAARYAAQIAATDHETLDAEIAELKLRLAALARRRQETEAQLAARAADRDAAEQVDAAARARRDATQAELTAAEEALADLADTLAALED